jgi:putative ABC transport system ATP-binding protein
MNDQPAPQACPSDGSVIHAEDVYKSYRRGGTNTPVLCGVSLSVGRGQCVYLAGPSGSGKTTLLSILGCILSPDRGQVRILGEDLGSLGSEGKIRVRRDRLGFIFQRFQLIRGLTALENVCVPLVLRGMTLAAARERGISVLEAVGLADKVAAHPMQLSAGQCQRVAMARALVGDPELILADEPTASLDARNGLEVMELLRRLTAEQGKTAIVVTHDQRIFRYADHIYWLEDGRITEPEERLDGTPERSPIPGSASATAAPLPESTVFPAPTFVPPVVLGE